MLIRVNLTATAEDLITELGSGAKLYLDSAATETGAYSNVTSTVLVAGQQQYELVDGAGTSSTWYRTRAGKADGSAYSAYSDPFRATALEAYASLLDVRSTGSWAGTGDDALLSDYLIACSAYLDDHCGRRFYRDPQVDGTTTWYADIRRPGRSSLIEAIGKPYTADGRALDIVSIATLEYRESETEAYASLGTEDVDWYLEAGFGTGRAGVDWPYEDVTLSIENGARTTWPTGKRAVKGVGVLGFPKVPVTVRHNTAEGTREWYRQGPGGGPAQVGTNQFGAPVYLTGMPPSVRAMLDAAASPYVKRSWVIV